MKLSKTLLQRFNHKDSILVLSSYPPKRGEIASENAVSRYTYLLLKNFPKEQKIIVICEKRYTNDKPFLRQKNILVIPSYTLGSPKFFYQLTNQFSQFSAVKNLHVQFEFSIFGGKISIPGFLAALGYAKTSGKNISIMLHQVVINIDSLSGHLGIKKHSAKSQVLERVMKEFYRSVGLISDTIIVHDSNLRDRLSLLVNKNMIQVIPHGIGKTRILNESYKKQSRENYGFRDQDFVVTAFGYHSWYKGTDWLAKQFVQYVQKNPNTRLKLLLAGGESPTLKGTRAYQNYSSKLHKLIEQNKYKIICTGYVPEKDVPKVFASSDLIVFPYRARMSASGALSLAWEYRMPFLVSEPFSENLLEIDVAEELAVQGVSRSDITFPIKGEGLFSKIHTLRKSKEKLKALGAVGSGVSSRRKWRTVANMYLECITHEQSAFSNTDLSQSFIR